MRSTTAVLPYQRVCDKQRCLPGGCWVCIHGACWSDDECDPGVFMRHHQFQLKPVKHDTPTNTRAWPLFGSSRRRCDNIVKVWRSTTILWEYSRKGVKALVFHSAGDYRAWPWAFTLNTGKHTLRLNAQGVIAVTPLKHLSSIKKKPAPVKCHGRGPLGCVLTHFLDACFF